MIRNSYGHRQWNLPGGGVGKNETPEKAAQREVLEEVGVQVSDLIPLGEYLSTRQYKNDTVYCFYAEIRSNSFEINNDEISEAAWFPKNTIPELHSSAVDKILNLYQSKFKQN